jgi:hypothetical protein
MMMVAVASTAPAARPSHCAAASSAVLSASKLPCGLQQGLPIRVRLLKLLMLLLGLLLLKQSAGEPGWLLLGLALLPLLLLLSRSVGSRGRSDKSDISATKTEPVPLLPWVCAGSWGLLLLHRSWARALWRLLASILSSPTSSSSWSLLANSAAYRTNQVQHSEHDRESEREEM